MHSHIFIMNPNIKTNMANHLEHTFRCSSWKMELNGLEKSLCFIHKLLLILVKLQFCLHDKKLDFYHSLLI
jgi:hypothetical protein